MASGFALKRKISFFMTAFFDQILQLSAKNVYQEIILLQKCDL